MKKRNNFFEEILKIENAAFVLDENKFIENIKKISNAFKTYYPKVKIGYSYKTNYVPRICKLAHANSCWAEVVSDMEVDFAFNNLGQEKTKIISFRGGVQRPTLVGSGQKPMGKRNTGDHLFLIDFLCYNVYIA